MRPPLDRARLLLVMDELGRRARGPGRVFLCGGATALLEGWRGATIDIDLRMDPEPAGVFAAIAAVKDALAVNIELASPRDFVPALEGADSRARFVARCGQIDFWHEDPYTQALAKLVRYHERDRTDLAAMVAMGLVVPTRLAALVEQAAEALLRYPALDAASVRARAQAFAEAQL